MSHVDKKKKKKKKKAHNVSMTDRSEDDIAAIDVFSNWFAYIFFSGFSVLS